MRYRHKNNPAVESDDVNLGSIKATTLDALTFIKEARNRIGWSVAELSKISGVSVGVISELEKTNSEKKKVPSLVNFIALTRALGFPKEYVLRLVFGSPYSRNQESGKEAEKIINDLRAYGIHDKESIDFIMQAIEFTKSRVKNKKIK